MNSGKEWRTAVQANIYSKKNDAETPTVTVKKLSARIARRC